MLLFRDYFSHLITIIPDVVPFCIRRDSVVRTGNVSTDFNPVKVLPAGQGYWVVDARIAIG